MALTTARRSRDILKGLPAEALKVLEGYRSAKLKASADWSIGPSAKRELIATLDAGAQAQLAEIEMAHRDAAEIFQAAVGAARGKPSPMGVPEQMAWERLRLGLDAARRRDSRAPLAQLAVTRLERAQKEGDEAMLRAARTMLGDFLGEPLARDTRRWLDIAAGDDETREAVALDEEGRAGIGHVKGAIGWAKGEIEGRFGANVMPTWDGKATMFDPPPDYAAAGRAAGADAAAVLAAAGYRPTAAGGIARTGGSGPAPAAASKGGTE